MPTSNLKAIRKALKLSQYDLAKLSGVERRLIMAAELNRKPLSERNEHKVKFAIEKEATRMIEEIKHLPAMYYQPPAEKPSRKKPQ